MKGKVIVFEGIDGAGTETQSKLLKAHFDKVNIPGERIVYPDYAGILGKIIEQFLHKKRELSAEMQFLLYAGDMVKDKEKIKLWLSEGKHVICDRYFNSTIVYQGLRGFRLEHALKFADDFGIPKPDVVIFLRITPEESARRKISENGTLDRNEEDMIFLGQVNNSYEKMATDNIFGQWFIINGEQPPDEVFKEVLNVLKSKGITKV